MPVNLILLNGRASEALKKFHPENSKRTFYVNIKIIFGLHVPFAMNFMFELKMLFKKIFDMTPGLI